MVIVTIDPVRAAVEELHALEAPRLSRAVPCARVGCGIVLKAAFFVQLAFR